MFHRNYIFALLLLIPLLAGGYFVFQSGNKTTLPENTREPSITVSPVELPKGWVFYQDKYISFGHPPSWEIRPVPNQDDAISEVLSVEQSETEKDVVNAPDTAYRIFVHKNTSGLDSMTFAKNDIAQNWHVKDEPTYTKYIGTKYDAVSVDHIVVGKTIWGQSLYLVSNNRAVQMISEVPVADPQTYLYPFAQTILFLK